MTYQIPGGSNYTFTLVKKDVTKKAKTTKSLISRKLKNIPEESHMLLKIEGSFIHRGKTGVAKGVMEIKYHNSAKNNKKIQENCRDRGVPYFPPYEDRDSHSGPGFYVDKLFSKFGVGEQRTINLPPQFIAVFVGCNEIVKEDLIPWDKKKADKALDSLYPEGGHL